MNKQEFIKKVMDLYPDTFKQERKEHYASWFFLYEVAIGNNWDYDKLMCIFAKEYKSVVIPPHPSFFACWKSEVVIRKEKHKPVANIPPEEKAARLKAFKEFQQKMKDLIEKKGL